MAEDTTNALGLDFSTLAVGEEQEAPQDAQTAPEPELPATKDAADAVAPQRKERPYFNPERVKTGGPQRVRRDSRQPAARKC